MLRAQKFLFFTTTLPNNMVSKKENKNKKIYLFNYELFPLIGQKTDLLTGGQTKIDQKSLSFGGFPWIRCAPWLTTRTNSGIQAKTTSCH
jgi:hypothetical protein